MAMAKKLEVNEGELKANAAKLGQKLGLLIALLFPKAEEQQAWLEIAAKMSPSQLLELTETLEQKYLEAFGRSIDEQYQEEIQAAVDDYNSTQKRINQKTLDQLQELENELEAK